MTTFGLPAECGRLIEYDTAADLQELRNAGMLKETMPIGGGSNILFTTGRFNGTILHCNNTTVNINRSNSSGAVEVYAAAGCNLDMLCAMTCAEGLWGMENLSGIPGEIGGAAVQNVGAYGAEFRDLVKHVICFDPSTGNETTIENADCRYGYRDSVFKHPEGKNLIVTGVVLALSPTPKPNRNYAALAAAFKDTADEKLTPTDFRNEILRLRTAKLPDPAIAGSAGSFFKNPVVSAQRHREISARFGREIPGHIVPAESSDATEPDVKLSAAWLIDNAGCKGFTQGGASLWPSQPLVIINTCGQATGEDVVALEKRIIQTVRNVFQVELSPEVIHI